MLIITVRNCTVTVVYMLFYNIFLILLSAFAYSILTSLKIGRGKNTENLLYISLKLIKQ